MGIPMHTRNKMTIQKIDYKTITIVPGSGTGTFCHTITKGKLPDSSEIIWYIKEMFSLPEAQIELLAQEFLRLIIPNQPKTRIAVRPAFNINTYYILSEEVTGYRFLPENEQNKFMDGTYRGLGQICLLAAFLHQIDLKNSNICLNDKKQVIGIDGDWAFACIHTREFADKPRAITEKL